VPKGRQVDGIDRKRKRNNNGVEQKKIRAYGKQQLVRVIPVIKKNQSKQTQGNVWSISKGGNEAKNVYDSVRTRSPQEEETSDDERKKRRKNRKSNKIITQLEEQQE